MAETQEAIEHCRRISRSARYKRMIAAIKTENEELRTEVARLSAIVRINAPSIEVES